MIKKLLFIIICFICTSYECSALEFKHDETGYYFEKKSNSIRYTSWMFEEYHIGDDRTYCMNIEVPFTDEYEIGSMDNVKLDSNIKERVSLIAYYGYDYLNHQNIKYLAATQSMIWEAVYNSDVYFSYSTKRFGKGDYLDISKEREEINYLVSHHYDKPNISNYYEIDNLNELVIEDELFSSFDVIDSLDYIGKIDDNKLIIKPLVVGDFKVKLKKKQYYDRSYIVYQKDNYQDMISAGNVDDIYLEFNVKSNGGTLTLNKLDFDNKSNVSSGEATLKGAIYGIYDLNDNILMKITTNDEGIAISDKLPYLGKYYVKEFSASKGYLLDDNKYYFESTLDNLNVSIDVYEKAIRSNVYITKLYETNKGNKLENNAKFEVYDNSNNLVGSYITLNGIASFDLCYGNYVVKQVYGLDGYKYVDDFNITIGDNKDINITLINKAIKGSLEVLKFGEEFNITNERFYYEMVTLDALFNLEVLESNYYDKNDVFTFRTNDDGIYIFDDLPVGRYLLKEIESSNNNLIDNNSYEIVISSFDLDEKITIYNYLPKSNLLIKKIDNDNMSVIPNTLFGLYTLEDLLVYKGYTNDNGVISINNLMNGKYILKELEANNEYVLDDTEYLIDIFNDNELVITNERVSIDISDTFSINYLYFLILGVLIIIFRAK